MPERLGPPRDAPLFERVAIVGFGLIGSSIARAARQLNLARAIVAIDRDEVVLERVRALGIADETTAGVSKFVKDASTNTWSVRPLKNPGAARGVAAIVDGSTVHLAVVTTTNRLVTFVDDGTDTAAVTMVATPATNTAFRSVAVAPTP